MSALLRHLGLGIALLLAAAVYMPGLSGSFLFDDYPNIVDNKALVADDLSFASLHQVALASDSSLFKRPLASLSFGANIFASGMQPLPMKITNLAIHLLNAALIYFLTLRLWRFAGYRENSGGLFAALLTAAWAVAPINLTAVLYVVQRMESLCQVFVLLGLLAYLHGRALQIAGEPGWRWIGGGLLFGTVLGLAAKESAILLPAYLLAAEWIVLRFRTAAPIDATRLRRLHGVVAALGAIATGLALYRYLAPTMWADRAFSLSQRVWTETRVLWSYIDWTLVPQLSRLGFYYDDYPLSNGLFEPVSTAFAVLGLLALAALAFALRRRIPLAALGIAWFLLGHALTATVLPLELVFEHRNYFSSFGLLLAVGGVLAHLAERGISPRVVATVAMAWIGWFAFTTALRASEWGHPLRLAESLAAKQPESARTQYELGRAYILVSNYDPASPLSAAATRVLERAAQLPHSSPLPEQGLLIQSQHLGVPDKESWWLSLQAKLRQRRVGPQETAALYALTRCVLDDICHFSAQHMVDSYLAALSNSASTEILGNYANYALNGLGDIRLALQLARDCVAREPREPQYRRNLIAILARGGDVDAARQEFAELAKMEGADAAAHWARAALPDTAPQLLAP